MNKLLSLLALGLALSLGAAHAADAPAAAAPAPAAKAPTAQQSKMATCNHEAAGKTGEPRKAFMKECLSAKPVAAVSEKKLAQQEKMKICNKDAGEKMLKGDERKKFMSNCLKG